MTSLTTLMIFLLWSWMFYDCLQNERGRARGIWILALILFNFLGAIAYFLIRWLPGSRLLSNLMPRRHKLENQLRYAIADVQNIGKSHQFAKLGHIHRAMRNDDHALAAYQQALTRDPNNVEALWGSAEIELQNKNLRQGSILLRRLMEVRSDFMYGDASLAYGQTLFDLGDFNLAQKHLETHLRQWSHPEAALLLAQIQAHQKNAPRACELLEKMVANVQGSPEFHYRKHRRQLVEGQRLLKKLKYQR